MSAVSAPLQPMLRLEEALARMLDGLAPLPAREVPLAEAHGLVLAEPIASRLELPPWDNSAMDGFAVRAIDVVMASKDRPVVLAVVGEAAAGRRAAAGVEPGTAVRILTGAPVPEGADAVVPIEDTDAPMGTSAAPTAVAVQRAADYGAHIRQAGSDLRVAARILEAGVVLGAAELAVAAAGGHAALPAHPRPRVAVLATGDELVAPGRPLGEAQIPDSNSIGLLAQAREAGADGVPLGIAGDRLEEVVERLRRGIAEADVVVVSGGVSVGAHDVVKDAFTALGRLELWRIAVQPGKPLAFGRAARPDAAGQVLMFGLPGNPVSSFVTFELFVRPVLRRLAGRPDTSGRTRIRARLAGPVTKSPGRRAFLRVTLSQTGDAWQAELSGGQSSHVLSALAMADGLAVVPEEVDGLPAGAEVEVIRLRPFDGEQRSAR